MDESRKEKILKAAEEEASCESISAGGFFAEPYRPPEEKKEPKFSGWVKVGHCYYRTSQILHVSPWTMPSDSPHCLVLFKGGSPAGTTVDMSAEDFLKLIVEAES